MSEKKNGKGWMWAIMAARFAGLVFPNFVQFGAPARQCCVASERPGGAS